VLGGKYGAAADVETLLFLRNKLPHGCQWGALGVGRHSYSILALATLLGGQVRSGMEDTLHIEPGILAPDNATLIRKGARLVESLGCKVASAVEAREILGLPKKGQSS
jgi:3-dehydrocarnitine:acetyl-CoA trimethylamine transferase